MVNLNILCVILTLLSSNTAGTHRNYHLKDLPYLGSQTGHNFRASSKSSKAKATTPEVHYVNVKSADNKTEEESEQGYGDDWVYALHTDEGKAELLNLTTQLNYEPINLLANRSLDFMSLQLITRRNKEAPENLTVDPYFEKPILRSKFFERKKRTKVLAHGWSPESIGIAEFKNLTTKYLELGDFNVIYVEWSAVSSEEFMLAVILFPYVARRLSVLLKAIIDTYNYKQDIHLIGHGIGAHILGYAAELSEKTIARITGLDPERPFFEKPKSQFHMLGRNDARFVDIIHTSKGIRGYKRDRGHIDFYPNDGKSPQPGCSGYPVIQQTCSHFRAVFYYVESLTSHKHFYAYPCKDFKSGTCDNRHTLMGEYVFTNLRGTYYLNTNNSEPFAIGKHVNLKEEKNIKPKISDSNPRDPCDEDKLEDDDGGGKGNETVAVDDSKDKGKGATAEAAVWQYNSDVWSDELDGDEIVDMEVPDTSSPTPIPLVSKNVEVTKVSETTSVTTKY